MGKPIAIAAALGLTAWKTTAAPVPSAQVTTNIMPANAGTPVDPGKFASAWPGARVMGLMMGASLLVILALYSLTF
jgi:hypothetical protein